ncbi:Elicitor-responsive protein 3 [Quillaja saponaria]|uniref:Elicitor-responsive protein 3 n=1 Tax=Quillaja saponaria TaxID=32244 RepID=A0AAD7KUI7_QUISA|nr:Elicitor-responsive protein 3 [Quillaja saponaria]
MCSMSITGIHGHQLEVTVSACNRLKNTELICRQDPYVCLEYGSQKCRTKTCTDGGKNPTFQEKFMFSLIEGLRELDVLVFNSNTFSFDDHIGRGKVQLQRVLAEGYDDSTLPLQTKTGRHAGEVKLILHYANSKKKASSSAPSAPPYLAPPVNQSALYPAPPPAPGAIYSAPATSYAPPTTAYHPSSPYPSYSSEYVPVPYPAPPAPVAYPSPPYPPTSGYPPAPYQPPPPASSSYYPPGAYPGTYPPPPYY